jgi:hypothetical protein
MGSESGDDTAFEGAMANTLNAGFQRIDHLARPFPVGSSERVTR